MHECLQIPNRDGVQDLFMNFKNKLKIRNSEYVTVWWKIVVFIPNYQQYGLLPRLTGPGQNTHDMPKEQAE